MSLMLYNCRHCNSRQAVSLSCSMALGMTPALQCSCEEPLVIQLSALSKALTRGPGLQAGLVMVSPARGQEKHEQLSDVERGEDGIQGQTRQRRREGRAVGDVYGEYPSLLVWSEWTGSVSTIGLACAGTLFLSRASGTPRTLGVMLGLDRSRERT
ncbi:hypothetical protein RRG08_006115 [Elysia crispata]|uniref:Uncharacterized protein n=1 Tax=Elysia crispata TaxID=231223 RepID=A0AAE0ZXB3_9GAST|nr:hypothetical protein RRG08_006115 [Elysia crispata]